MSATQLDDDFAANLLSEIEHTVAALRDRLARASNDHPGELHHTRSYVSDARKYLAVLDQHLDNRAAIVAEHLHREEREHVREVLG